MKFFPVRLGWMAVFSSVLGFALLVGVPLAGLVHSVSGQALFDPIVLGVARATAVQAFVSAVFSAVIGLPLGLWVWRSRAARTLLAVPYGVPVVVAATAWVAWLGRSGVLALAGVRLDMMYRFEAVVLAHVAYNAPWIALLVAQARARVPERLVEAAATLGAGRGEVFRFVLWPEVRWAFAAACMQVVSVCAMSFVLVQLLGGGPPVETLEVAVFARVRSGTVDFEAASALALWELLLTLVPWLLVLFLRRRARMDERGVTANYGSSGFSRPTSRSAVTVCAFFVLPYFVVFSPEVMLVFASSEFWEQVAPAFWISAQIMVLSSVTGFLLALVGVAALAFLAPRMPRLQVTLAVALNIPAGLSLMMLGLGFFFVYGRWVDPFEGSLAAIVALQSVSLAPIALRMLWPLAQTLNYRELEAAAVLGASPLQGFLHVEWPRWRKPVVSALALLAGVAVGEVSAVSLFYSEALVPLPLVASRWMAQYRFEAAQAVSALLLAMAIAIISGVHFFEGQEIRA